MSKVVKLSEEDRKELLKLYEKAETTPVIRMQTLGPSWADNAWERVRRQMDKLGEKYGFNPAEMKGIKKKTGEVMLNE